jgi:hypothetical protein
MSANPVHRFVAGASLALTLTVGAGAQITGSPHDFSALDSEHRICVFCHTPHNADTTVIDAPLWNHQVTTRTYTLYNSPTLDATVNQPTGASRLCLSCHDGSVAVDAYGGRAGTIFLAGPIAVGADGLQNDHPISFQYSDALAAQDGELHPPSVSPSLLGGTIAQDLLFNGSLECASCHDVHNGHAAAAIDDNLLVITQQGSRICLVCHDK